MKIQRTKKQVTIFRYLLFSYTFSLFFDYYMDVLLLLQILCTHFSTSFAIHTCGNNAACVSGTLTTWEETLDTDMHQGFSVTYDADRRRGAGLHRNQSCLIGEKTMRILSKSLKAFLQAL